VNFSSSGGVALIEQSWLDRNTRVTKGQGRETTQPIPVET